MTDTAAGFGAPQISIVPAAATGMRLAVTRPVYFLWPLMFAIALLFAGPLAVQAVAKAAAASPDAARAEAVGASSGADDAATSDTADAGETETEIADNAADVDEDADAAPAASMWRVGACKAKKASANAAAEATAEPDGGGRRGGPRRGGPSNGPGGPGDAPQGPPSPAAQAASMGLGVAIALYLLALQGSVFRLLAGRVAGAPVFSMRFGGDELRLLVVAVMVPLMLAAAFAPFAAAAFASAWAPGPCAVVEPLAIVAYVGGGLAAADVLCRAALFGPAVVTERRFAFGAAWAKSGERLDVIIAGTLAGLITAAILILIPGNLIVLGLTVLLSSGGQTAPQAFLGALGQLTMSLFIFVSLLSLLGMVGYVYVRATTGQEPAALKLTDSDGALR